MKKNKKHNRYTLITKTARGRFHHAESLEEIAIGAARSRAYLSRAGKHSGPAGFHTVYFLECYRGRTRTPVYTAYPAGFLVSDPDFQELTKSAFHIIAAHH